MQSWDKKASPVSFKVGRGYHLQNEVEVVVDNYSSEILLTPLQQFAFCAITAVSSLNFKPLRKEPVEA